jgi:UDP-N-acetylmuramoylalanine--D-glutamate ligase
VLICVKIQPLFILQGNMINTDYYKNKKVTVAGFGCSGLACANLLYSLGAGVWVTDNKDNQITQENLSKLNSKSIKVELGKHTKPFIKNKDLLVISPGVPDNALPVVWAKDFKIPIISEIELAWGLCPGTVIAVTGSNGKTTVTTLISRILEAEGENVFTCGNIGNPFSGEVAKIREKDFVSLEVSSFQLEHIKDFKPKIAVILNFTPNHLDRYKDTQEYLKAKKRIFMNQDENDCLILNNNDPVLRGLAREAKPEVIFFCETSDLNPNQSAVLAVGRILGIDKNIILNVFKEFKGMEHRLEFVTELNNIKFINDSKATTVDSCIWALKNINRPVVLIAGGKDKGLDYNPILDLAREKVKEVVLIGEAREKLRYTFMKYLSIEEADTLEEAVGVAYSKARPGDCILLSPMCSSLDMFSNYEERGKRFKKAVFDLMRKNGQKR